MLIDSNNSQLLLIDVQEKLAPIVSDPQRVLRNVSIFIRAAALHKVPIIASEQYPKGLGHTVPEIGEFLPDAPGEKTEFSCLANPALRDRILASGRDVVLIAGIEAHVCVLQSAFDLLEAGKAVYAVADAMGSRTMQSYNLGLERMRAAGAVIVTTEMVVFEFLRDAKADAFRELSRLIR